VDSGVIVTDGAGVKDVVGVGVAVDVERVASEVLVGETDRVTWRPVGEIPGVTLDILLHAEQKNIKTRIRMSRLLFIDYILAGVCYKSS
jgi:hypothetical protein